MNIITKIKQTMNFQKAKRYFENVNINELIQKSEWVQSLCINENIGKGCYRHHLPLKQEKYPTHYSPDDWDLPKETTERIMETEKELEQFYVYALWLATEGEGYITDENVKKLNFSYVKNKMLPTWIAFPIYDSASMAWRQWLENYSTLFHLFLNSLSEKERLAYCERYPLPPYFGGELQGAIENYQRF